MLLAFSLISLAGFGSLSVVEDPWFCVDRVCTDPYWPGPGLSNYEQKPESRVGLCRLCWLAYHGRHRHHLILSYWYWRVSLKWPAQSWVNSAIQHSCSRDTRHSARNETFETFLLLLSFVTYPAHLIFILIYIIWRYLMFWWKILSIFTKEIYFKT